MKLHVIVLYILFASFSAFAITPEEAADAILGRNGDYIGAIMKLKADNLEATSISNLPDPEIEGAYLAAPSGVTNRWDVGISYSMEWPGVYGARRNMSNAVKSVNNAELESFVAAKKLEILKSIEDYILADKKLSLMTSMAEATDSLRLITEKGIHGGQMSRLDLAKISLEQGRIKTLLSSVNNEKNNAIGVLQTLNGGYDCIALLERIDSNHDRPVLMQREYYLEAMSHNPEFLKSVADYESAISNLKVAKAEGLPSLKIGYSHNFEDGTHFNGANLGVSIPIFSNRGKTKAAKATAAAAEQEMSLVTNRMESEIGALYNQIASLDSALKTPDEIFGSTDYPVLLLKAFKGGEISLTEYLQERNWFFESHLDYLELQYQRASAMHTLQSLTLSR